MKRDTTISSLLEISQENERTHSSHKECGACEEVEELVKFCKTCQASLCRKCSHTHAKFKVCRKADLISVRAMEVQTRSRSLVDKSIGEIDSLLTTFKSYMTKTLGNKVKEEIQFHVDDILTDIEIKRIQLFDEVDSYYASKADMIQKRTNELHRNQATLVSLTDKLKNINLEASVEVETKVKQAKAEIDKGAECIKSFDAFQKELLDDVVFEKNQMKKDCEIGHIMPYLAKDVDTNDGEVIQLNAWTSFLFTHDTDFLTRETRKKAKALGMLEDDKHAPKQGQGQGGLRSTLKAQNNTGTRDENVSASNSQTGRGCRGGRGSGRNARMETNKYDYLPPSPCVFVRSLSAQAGEQDLVNSLDGFGNISDIKLIPSKRQALVEFVNIEEAINCVEYNQNSPIYCAGHPAFFNYSTSTHIVRQGRDRDSYQDRDQDRDHDRDWDRWLSYCNNPSDHNFY